MGEHDENKPDLSAGVAISSIPEGSILAGMVGEESVLLTRAGDEVRAFAGKCTHLGAPLEEGLCVDGEIRCPWHHARFDLRTGEALAAPAFDALQPWDVERRGDLVVVTRPAPTPNLACRAFEGHSDVGMVIVGGGAAGYAAAHALRQRGHEGSVTMISGEASEPYDRTLLTKDYLDGKFGDDHLPIARTSLGMLNVTFIGGCPVDSIDAAARHVHLADGRSLPYTKLLLATGAEPKRLDVPGADLPHVCLLRSLADCRAIMARLDPGASVAVVGSSFIGLEAAASIRSRGFDVVVVTPEIEPMAKILGQDLARAILSTHTKKGVTFRTGSTVEAITPLAVHLKGGTSVPADLVVVGIGVEPRVDLARQAGLRVDNGVIVDRLLRTSEPDIYAAGDIANWPDARTGMPIRVEHWAVAERQGQTAAANMLGEETPFSDVPFFWSKHFDMSFRYVGHADSWDEAVVEGDLGHRKALIRYRKNGRELAVATVGEDFAAMEIERRMEDLFIARPAG